MANLKSSTVVPTPMSGDFPVVGMREPCPCGGGRRYKACHGRSASHAATELVLRPFEGLASECDWVALREIVPAATARLTLRPEYATDRAVTLATVLPGAWPAIVRADGHIYLGLQTQTGSGDASRDTGGALLRALSAEPGDSVPFEQYPTDPRLQDMVDIAVPLEVVVHEGFDFWVEGIELTPEMQASLDRANGAAVATERLVGVSAAYWCRIGPKEHLRWVLPYDEDPLLDAFARLRAAGRDGLGDGTKLIGSFRAAGLLAPVWDLVPGTNAAQIEEPAAAWLERLKETLAQPGELTTVERRARAGLMNRQLTLR